MRKFKKRSSFFLKYFVLFELYCYFCNCYVEITISKSLKLKTKRKAQPKVFGG